MAQIQTQEWIALWRATGLLLPSEVAWKRTLGLQCGQALLGQLIGVWYTW